MRSQIPRPDQRFAKVVKVGGQDTLLPDEVWYRYLTAEHTDIINIETESALALLATPNMSPVQRAANDARTFALTKRDHGSDIQALRNKFNELLAFIFSGQRTSAASSAADNCLPVVEKTSSYQILNADFCGTLFIN